MSKEEEEANFWTSYTEDDFKQVPIRNKGTPSFRNSSRGNNYNGYGGRGGGGRGYNSSRPQNPYADMKQEPHHFSDTAFEIVSDIVSDESLPSVSQMDFGKIVCPRENFIAVLYVAAHRGCKKYHGSRTDLANRWRFTSEDKLFELINDPEKMEDEVYALNSSKGGPPALTEYSRLNDFPEVVGKDVLRGIGSTTDPTQKKQYQMLGVRRFIARCFGVTQEAKDFAMSLANLDHQKLAEFYNKPDKFIQAAWQSRPCPAWNPVLIPKGDLQRKKNQGSESNSRQESNSSNWRKLNTQVALPSTPNQNSEDIAKALHEPNSEIKLDERKLLLFNTPQAGHSYCKSILVPYLSKHYTKSTEMAGQLDSLDNQKITRLILVPGELERWAKTNGAQPMSAVKQTEREIAALRKNDTEVSYVVQYSKKYAKDLKANEALISIYSNVLHPIADSFHCQFGMEYVNLPDSDATIWDPEDIANGVLDDAFIANTTNEKYNDTLQFQFRVTTRVDMVNMLSRTGDFNVHSVTPSKTLLNYLKEQHIYLTLVWKSPPEFDEVAMIVGSTSQTKVKMVYKEIDYWLRREHNIIIDTGRFKARVRDKINENGSEQEMLLILSDPAISEELGKLLLERDENLDRGQYPETYDYRFYAPDPEVDSASYHEGLEAQSKYVRSVYAAEFGPVRHNLFEFSPASSDEDHHFDEEPTISENLINSCDDLYIDADGIPQKSPFAKLYSREGNMWIITWPKTNQESAVYYLEKVFRNDLRRWTKREYISMDIKIPSTRKKDATGSTAPNTSIESSTMEGSEDLNVDEFGRKRRTPGVNVGTQVQMPQEVPPPEPKTDNREAVSRTSSSLTAITAVNNINATWGYGGYYPQYAMNAQQSMQQHPMHQNPPQQYNLQLQDNGGVLTIDQLNEVLKTVENRTYQVMSTSLQSILAFHDPVTGIKQLMDRHLSLLNQTIKDGIDAKTATPDDNNKADNDRLNLENDELPQETITRARSLNDLQIAPNDTNSVTLIEGGASYHPSFNPPEQRNMMRVGGANDMRKTGFTTPAFQGTGPKHQPESYRGPLREVGDGVMRQLDEQLAALPTNPTTEAAMAQDDGTSDSENGDTAQTEATEEERDQDKQADAIPEEEAELSTENESVGQPHATEDIAARRSTRASKSTSQNQTQTNNETTTGDPPASKSAAKRGVKKKNV